MIVTVTASSIGDRKKVSIYTVEREQPAKRKEWIIKVRRNHCGTAVIPSEMPPTAKSFVFSETINQVPK
jgi:hypothetical protein